MVLYSKLLLFWAYLHLWKWKKPLQERRLRREVDQVTPTVRLSKPDSEDADRTALMLAGFIVILAVLGSVKSTDKGTGAPKFAEYLLYLFLSKRDREHLIGDLSEEYMEVRAKFGRRAANVWYYKQVVTSIWPLSRKAVRWGLVAWVGEWVRRHM